VSFLKGKKVLIVGLLSSKSIAYGVAEALSREGAELAFTYQNERFRQRVINLTSKYKPKAVIECDVSKDEDIRNTFNELKQTWSSLDGIVHSVAYAPSDQLEGDFISVVNREGFKVAHDISSYSFAALAKEARPMMKGRNASMVTLSYLGAEKAMPNYNIMGVAKASLESIVRYSAFSLGKEGGIRVNAVSAGPIRTLAASGIKNFRKILDYSARVSPLRKNVSIKDVGNTVAFLISDLASGITGEVIHVDSGYHCVSMSDLI
jgi:enoyl-[acyl-carrier protein] reductase I